MQAAVLLIVAAQNVTAPTPFFRTDNQRRRINGFDLAGVVDHLIFDLIHRRAGGMDVAMGGVPDARFVVENVIAQTTGRSSCPSD